MITAKVREEVLLSGDCAYCGGIPTQVDHIIPRSRGGTDDRSNLAPACTGCNMEKLDFTPEEYRAYREEEGLGWPPQSVGDFIRELIKEQRATMGDEYVDRAIDTCMRRALARAEKAREAERAAEIDALTAERASIEEKAADYRIPLPSLLQRLKKIDARLEELRP